VDDSTSWKETISKVVLVERVHFSAKILARARLPMK
jgi:hypothetical protein